MKRDFFGTDGVRGQTNGEVMNSQFVLRLAMATAEKFRRGNHRHRVLIGKDTRLSGYMLEPALTSGFVAMGMDVLLTGPMPTPAVAMLTRTMRADLGVMLSASHNPYIDNGIKFFAPDGYKLSDEDELEIEGLIKDNKPKLAKSTDLGRAKRIDDAPGRYIEFVKSSFPSHLRLDGLKLVVDCAHGAAYHIAPIVFRELGAEVITLGIEPNGMNINDGLGAVHPEKMAELTLKEGADMGIALDGDADRLIIADEKGEIINGDQIMAVIAKFWQIRGRLKNPVITTIMANQGLEDYLYNEEIDMKRVGVGDRPVVEAMRQLGANLGGEPSGHIVVGDKATTGDGIMAALQLLAAMVELKQPFSQLGKSFEPTPMLEAKIKTSYKKTILDDAKIAGEVVACEARLRTNKPQGRLVIRPSGTEDIIRLMIECHDQPLAKEIKDKLETLIKNYKNSP